MGDKIKWRDAKDLREENAALRAEVERLREAVAALWEAVEILDDEGWLGMSKHRILALIDKEPENG